MRILIAVVGAAAAALVAVVSGGPATVHPAVAAVSLQAPTDPLPAACTPFGTLASNRPIDQTCGLQGAPGATNGEHTQNRVKNNFCAHQSGAPATITRFTFDQLQSHTPSKTTLPWGSGTNIPGSDAARAALHGIYTTTNGDTVGEGSYVQFVAFILEGHFGGSESVDCGETIRQNIDIHLALLTDRPWTLDLTNNDTECTSVTAEIISHHRPVDWDVLGRMTGTPASQKLTKAQSRLADEDLQRPLRIRGQLMFDASHSLCANGHRTSGNPARRSGWEIHPIYSIDVCNAKTLTTCKIDDPPPRWKPLDQWLADQQNH